MNHRQEYSYDLRGQNTGVIDALGNNSAATYDALGNITALSGGDKGTGETRGRLA